MNPKHHRKRDFKKGLAMHVVLKSNLQVFLGKQAREMVDALLQKFAKHFEVKIYHRAHVGTHVHLILLPKTQTGLSGFLMKLSKGRGPFWRSRPWSRLIQEENSPPFRASRQ